MSNLRSIGQNVLRGFREVVDEGRARYGNDNMFRASSNQLRNNPAGFIPPHAQQAMANAAQAMEFTDAGDVKAYQDTTRAALDALVNRHYKDAAMNAPGVAASLASLAIPGIGFGGAIKAYHGTPYDFDKFDAAKIGTGEGAQAYGHGLYFAENEGVARSYRDQLAGGADRFVGGQPYDSKTPEHLAASLMKTYEKYGGRDRVLKVLQDDIANLDLDEASRNTYQRTLDLVQGQAPIQEFTTAPKGRMYEVEIDAEPEDFLDWDTPFQSADDLERFAARFDSVNPAIRKRIEDYGYSRQQNNQPMPDGSDLVREVFGGIGSRDAVESSRLMQEAGVRGIKYLDQGSRGAADGTRNYVVFDPNQVEIKRKY
jgi:hypothetical protein